MGGGGWWVLGGCGSMVGRGESIVFERGEVGLGWVGLVKGGAERGMLLRDELGWVGERGESEGMREGWVGLPLLVRFAIVFDLLRSFAILCDPKAIAKRPAKGDRTRSFAIVHDARSVTFRAAIKQHAAATRSNTTQVCPFPPPQ